MATTISTTTTTTTTTTITNTMFNTTTTSATTITLTTKYNQYVYCYFVIILFCSLLAQYQQQLSPVLPRPSELLYCPCQV